MKAFSSLPIKTSQKQEIIEITTLDELFELDDSCIVTTSSHLIEKHTTTALFSPTNVSAGNSFYQTNTRLSGGKRSSSSHYENEFPPMHKSTSYSQISGATPKKLQSNAFMNEKQATTASSHSLSQNNLAQYLNNSQFQPKFLSEDYKNSCYIVSSLNLDEILREMEYTFKDLNNSESFQRCHYEYHNLDFAWNVFVMKSTHHCQMKLKIFQIKMNDHRFNSSSSESSTVKKYLIDLTHEDGDKSVFYHVFHLIKDALVQMEDCFPNLSTALKSSCGIQEQSSSTTSSKKVTVKGIGMNSITEPEKLSNHEFYSQNMNILLKWKSDLENRATTSPMIQLEAVKNFLSLCQSSLTTSDTEMFAILERNLQLVQVLLGFFHKKTSANKSEKMPTSYPVVHHDEEIWLKPYIIQIFNFFKGSGNALRLMSDCEGLREYLSKVSQVNNPSKLKLIIGDCDELCQSILYNHMNGGSTTPAVSVKANPALNNDFFSPTKCSSYKNGKVY